MTFQEINRVLGNVDLYLLDQILKGRFEAPMKVLDAGCGEGRNLLYFLQNGFEVYGVDQEPLAIKMVQMHPLACKDHFVQAPIEGMPFSMPVFDVVICNAVLHFARNHAHFDAMWAALVQVMKPGGTLFIRTCGEMGMRSLPGYLGEGRYLLADGSERYLLLQDKLVQCLESYGLKALEPLKAVNVEGKRSMVTLVLTK